MKAWYSYGTPPRSDGSASDLQRAAKRCRTGASGATACPSDRRSRCQCGRRCSFASHCAYTPSMASGGSSLPSQVVSVRRRGERTLRKASSHQQLSHRLRESRKRCRPWRMLSKRRSLRQGPAQIGCENQQTRACATGPATIQLTGSAWQMGLIGATSVALF